MSWYWIRDPKDNGRHGQLSWWIVDFKAAILVKESVNHARKDLTVSRIVRHLCPLQQPNQVIDGDLLFVHLTIVTIHFLVNILCKRHDVQAGLLSF